MEGIPFDIEPSEVIPFDLEAPFLLFPVRHHSPVCSYHLLKAIKLYSPDIILIEGPENANDIIPVLTDERTTLPAALYYFYKDKKKLISDSAEDYKCYYPFQYSSPEYNAMTAAKRAGIPARFIDLPYCEILINTADNKGLRQGDDHSYLDDSRLAKGEFYKRLCEKTGIRSFEEFWEKYFEISGLYMPTEQFVTTMHTYCMISRAQTSEKEMRADATLARESYMAANILEAMKNHKKVLAVTGGFHSKGLYDLIISGSAKKQKLHSVPAELTGCFPAAYSYEAADALHGYSSGMRYPYFYDCIFRAVTGEDGFEGAYSAETLDLLVRTAKESAKRDIPVAISDVTSAHTMMSGLAALRGVRECGIYELIDGITSTFIKGEKTVSSALPLGIINKLATGDGVGHIGDLSHVSPLITDFEDNCNTLKLRCNTAVPQECDVALFTSSKGLALSRFLHRMKFLETGFCNILKGPDLRHGKDRNRVREQWEYRRSPSVDAALIDHTADGFTIEEACINIARKRLAGERRCEAAASIAVECFLMGINPDDDSSLLQASLSSDGDFFSVGKGMYYFEMLYDLHRLYEYNGSTMTDFLDRAFSKLIAVLPQMSNVPDEQADDLIKIIRQMYGLTDTVLKDRRGELYSALLLLTEADDKHPAVYGAAMGLLYAFDNSFQLPAEQAMQSFLNGSLEVKKLGADYIKGLFTTARDIVFADNDFLKMTDKLIVGMSSDDFMEILPSLRLAFGSFTPREVQDTAKAVASLYDMNGDDILDKAAIDEGLYNFGSALDREILGELLGGKSV